MVRDRYETFFGSWRWGACLDLRGLEVISKNHICYSCQHSEGHYNSPKARQGIASPKMLSG